MKTLCILAVLIITTTAARPCTIFTASDGKQVLVGNNEDYTPGINTFLWVRPQEGSNNGYVFWGFEEKYPEGGMNDKGLFYDAAALPKQVPLKRDPSRKDYNGYIVEAVLQHCSTVKEVIEWVSRYNLTWYQKVQVMVVDKTGDYAIINAGYIIHPVNRQFVLTNYNLNNPADSTFSCWRRNTARQMLQGQAPSAKLFAGILNQVAQRETDNATVYSQVCNLTTGSIHLYQRHNFTEEKEINLAQILAQGKQNLQIKSLFAPVIADTLQALLKQKGVDSVLAFYKVQKGGKSAYRLSAENLTGIGYNLIDSSRLPDALTLLAANAKYYPHSDAALAALAAAHLVQGDTTGANPLYKRALAINPKNYTATLMAPHNGTVTFRVNGMAGATSIALAGSFNNYDNKANYFTRQGNQWVCTIKLAPGQYTYKFCINDNNWVQDAGNPLHHKPNQWWDSYVIVQ